MNETPKIEEGRVEFTGVHENLLAATRFSPTSFSTRPPILLMHGGGQTRHSWNGTARLLAQNGYLAYTIDARGHGGSDWLDNKHYRLDDYSADLRALVEQIQENTPPIVIGASMGGLSAMISQAEGGLEEGVPLFTAIILVDITPRMEVAGVNKIMGFMSKNMQEGFASVEDAADVIATYLPNRPRPKSLDGLQKNLRQRDDGRWYWHWDPAFVDGPHNISTGRETRINELLDAVKLINVPTLLVRGSKSELVSQEAAEEFLELVPHAKFVDVNDAGHMVAGDKNDIFAAAAIEFLTAELEK